MRTLITLAATVALSTVSLAQTTPAPSGTMNQPGTMAPGTMAPGATAPAPTPAPGTMGGSAASPSSGSPTGSSNAAVNPSGNAPSSVNASGTATMVAPSALERGANSFTEGQTRSRLEGAGLTNVTDLMKDDGGIWRGKAMRGGQSVAVGFDYKGNIAAQ